MCQLLLADLLPSHKQLVNQSAAEAQQRQPCKHDTLPTLHLAQMQQMRASLGDYVRVCVYVFDCAQLPWTSAVNHHSYEQPI